MSVFCWYFSLILNRMMLHQSLYLLTEGSALSLPVCLFVSRLQDAVSLVSLFHMVQPHSESAQEAASQKATGIDLLKVTTHKLDRKCPLTRSSVLHLYSLCSLYIIYCHLIQKLPRSCKWCPSGIGVNQESV